MVVVKGQPTMQAAICDSATSPDPTCHSHVTNNELSHCLARFYTNFHGPILAPFNGSGPTLVLYATILCARQCNCIRYELYSIAIHIIGQPSGMQPGKTLSLVGLFEKYMAYSRTGTKRDRLIGPSTISTFVFPF